MAGRIGIVRVGNMFALGRDSEPSCVVVGPHWPMLFCTFTLIVAPSIVFLAVIGPTRSVLENLIYAGLFVITLVSFTVTAFKDPGICARQAKVDTEDGATIMFAPSTPDGAAQSGPFQRRSSKFCKYCNVHQPINSVHCQDCGVCVRGLDHHCPWTGKCIGQGNLPFFHGFLCGLLALIIAFIVMTVQYATDTGGSNKD